jgi:CRP-like cAMP-binding protein
LASERDPLSKPPSRSPSKQSRAPVDNRLDHIPLLNILSGKERERILRELTESRYGKDEFIFREGDPAEYFHIVKEGTVKCITSSPGGKECALKMLLPGDLFCCDAAVFDNACHPGTAQPMGDVSILRLKKKTYFDLLRRNPEAAIEVIKYLGNRLREAQERAKMFALGGAEQRLAALLVDLAARSGVQEPHGVRLSVRITREDMANMVGTSTETVIRIMSRFKRDQLVAGTANRLVVRNLSGLKSMVSS